MMYIYIYNVLFSEEWARAMSEIQVACRCSFCTGPPQNGHRPVLEVGLQQEIRAAAATTCPETQEVLGTPVQLPINILRLFYCKWGVTSIWISIESFITLHFNLHPVLFGMSDQCWESQIPWNGLCLHFESILVYRVYRYRQNNIWTAEVHAVNVHPLKSPRRLGNC